MSAAEVVRARIDPDLKREATAVLAGMGLSVSDAIRMMLVRVAAEGALPFEVKTPNRETKAAMRATEEGDVKRFDTLGDLLADLNDD
ncbi:type II toxin-antitoxin system RelB/DinJ family antitoxin [Aquibium sp. ELW1220]|uniref:type II toxin-antitoxin system RelB/DinJ family antitoxin n=1 Tax=Aquibium sp. ELW1220 TaxID=2976766 RepID=UPI0025AF541C|nr:type II toxin-antitoxin system RelB/DinJ family antitoxin [Aquibium sp. ELW1220]MDN2583621.1 type II toxin-antitoxin system RelB/DinJ family antitoxin [Aquibium sp. ELW1220]